MKDGSTWRFVKGNNMDKTSQKMTCEYLGFGAADTSVGNSGLRRGNNMATGDFICYKREPGEVSCCVHLKPHTNGRLIFVPFLTCECMAILI